MVRVQEQFEFDVGHAQRTAFESRSHQADGRNRRVGAEAKPTLAEWLSAARSRDEPIDRYFDRDFGVEEVPGPPRRVLAVEVRAWAGQPTGRWHQCDVSTFKQGRIPSQGGQPGTRSFQSRGVNCAVEVAEGRVWNALCAHGHDSGGTRREWRRQRHDEQSVRVGERRRPCRRYSPHRLPCPD